MQKALFIRRTPDGTILLKPPDKQVDTLEKLRFYPGVIVNLHRIATELDYELVLLTTSPTAGSSTGQRKSGTAAAPAHQKMLEILEGEGIRFAEIVTGGSFSGETAPTRESGAERLTRHLQEKYDLANSYVIGHRPADVRLAEKLGARAILIGKKVYPGAALTTRDWAEIYHFLRFPERVAEVRRQTGETDVQVRLNLDGTGQTTIHTGLGFFDHMLQQVARHSGCDLTIQVNGDLHVDEHHTIEDTALALGEAYRRALGNKRGIERYGFLLPMDDSLAQVALDFSGRSWLVWEVDFRREKVGDVPTEMFRHFFKSFCDAAGCNLHVRASGENEHHKIEAVFKSFARSLRMAVRRDRGAQQIPSTKGVL